MTFYTLDRNPLPLERGSSVAGADFIRIKALKGTEVLRDREVVISKDTNELFVGKGDGRYDLLNGVHMGTSTGDMQNLDPVDGRLFFNESSGLLYLANGTGWKRIGIRITFDSGLKYNEETGELKVNIDNNSIIINKTGQLETNNADYGEF